MGIPFGHHTSGAPRSESTMEMIAGGNHTMAYCGLVRNDRINLMTLIHFISLLFFILQDCRGDPFLRAEARRTEQ